jgi:hypothetical protein
VDVERREAETALRLSAERFRAVIEHNADANDQAEVRAVAAACLTRHGYTVLEAARADEAPERLLAAIRDVLERR